MLEVDSIDVQYGDLQVLWGVSLTVEEKEILAVLGSNGAGKSSLLKTLTGLLRPTKGIIRFNGVSLDRVPGHKRVEMGICLIPEGRGLFSGMSILENLELGAYNATARVQRKETLEFVYSIFPILKKRKEQIAGTLSGGEQQMVAIGRGLMSKPRLLLLDEPSLGLAPLLVEEIFEAIGLINQSGVTVVLVEQNVRASLEFAHRGYIIEGGRIVGQGEGKSLLNDDRVKEAYLGLDEA